MMYLLIIISVAMGRRVFDVDVDDASEQAWENLNS